eukprot:TRINITY_DN10229_c0_g1_i3.p1 TRINITY_DN10229_c0_g1~~TRINITY_DN10229_c0_g1_i3.p1  ORF type:complete len:166 (+),score=10.84 TRINITY_DN10229_c0_g1_i3:78-575(+)
MMHHDHSQCRKGVLRLSLWSACDLGDLHSVRDFLLHKGTNPNRSDEYGYTPLHNAASSGHLEICELLLQHGASVNAAECGATPLHRAAFRGHTQVCALLLRHGADPNLPDLSTDHRTPLHKAASQGHVAICRLLLQHGAETDRQDKQGKTPSEVAANDAVRQVVS